MRRKYDQQNEAKAEDFMGSDLRAAEQLCTTWHRPGVSTFGSRSSIGSVQNLPPLCSLGWRIAGRRHLTLTNHAISLPSGLQGAYDKLGNPISLATGATSIDINGPTYLIID